MWFFFLCFILFLIFILGIVSVHFFHFLRFLRDYFRGFTSSHRLCQQSHMRWLKFNQWHKRKAYCSPTGQCDLDLYLDYLNLYTTPFWQCILPHSIFLIDQTNRLWLTEKADLKQKRNWPWPRCLWPWPKISISSHY